MRIAAIPLAAVAALATQPAQAQTYAYYQCANGAQFEVAFFPETKSAYVQLDGKALILPRGVAYTGTRYAKGGVTFWIRGKGATLKRAGVTTQCTTNSPVPPAPDLHSPS